MRIVVLRRGERPTTFTSPSPAGRSPLLIWWDDNITRSMLQQWCAIDVGAMRFQPRGDGTLDLMILPQQAQKVELLGYEGIQQVLLAALDLLTEVENADGALIPDSVSAAAQRFRKVANVTG